MIMVTTPEKIFAWYESRHEDGSNYHSHLGASQIGHPCERKLWYDFRHVKKLTYNGRVLRLFKTGNIEERRILRELKEIGIEFKPTPHGRQHHFIDSENRWFSGSTDGIARGFPENPDEWHIVEIKTANEQNFRGIRANGVIVEKPEHYAQMQCYMGWSGIHRAAYIVVNKNTDNILIDFLEFEPEIFEKLRARAARVVNARSPPKRTMTFNGCLFCPYSEFCTGAVKLEDINRNCRTCIHWRCDTRSDSTCARGNSPNSAGFCIDYTVIPELVSDGEKR